jgi:DAACS family dicarboxylate/amino acid:cation (Na+ or H+) symporter
MTDQASRGGLALHWQILIGLLIGASLGIAANLVAAGQPPEFQDQLRWWALNVVDPLGRVFLRLVFMVVIPLVFSALALGVAEIGDVGRLGKVGLRTLGLTAGLSLTAVILGIGLVNFFEPGRTLPPEKSAALREEYASAASTQMQKANQAKSIKDTLLDIIPENPLQEMVGAVDGSSKGNGMLAVMFFSLMFGIAVTRAPEKCQTLVAWLEGLNAVSMVIIGFAMRLAPYAVACLVFSIASRLGLDILRPLLGFTLTVLAGLAIQLVVVYSLVLWWFGCMSPMAFFRNISEAMLTAFATSSSSATLPTALRVAQEKLQLPRDTSNFVLTIGATGNQNGTALYEGVVVLFLAQVFNVELTFLQQIQVVLMSVLAGIGTAGVPGGSLPLIVVVMQSVGIPGEGIGIILGIDRILDMCRTVLNVTGDLAIAACVAQRKPAGESSGLEIP